MPIKRHRCLYLNRKRESELLNTDKIKNYTIIEKKELPEVSGTGYLLRHDKTKARVMLIDNDDENKVFCKRIPLLNFAKVRLIHFLMR